MKAVILCAGRGTRLRPLTHTGAKHLLPVANRPILFHVLDDLTEAGVTEVCVVISEGAQDLRDALEDGQPWGVSICYAVQESPKGLAHAVKMAQDFVGDEPFLVYLGDNLFEEGVQAFISRMQGSKEDSAVLLHEVADPRAFGVAQLDRDGRLTAVEEKPAEPPSNLALTGVYYLQPGIFDAIDHLRPSARGELEITDAIQAQISNGQTVLALKTEGWWRDTGRPDDVLDVNRLLLEAMPNEEAVDPDAVNSDIEGRAYFEKGVRVKDSLIRGPSIIGEGCHVEGAFVGPFTSVGKGCTLQDVEMENSIVMPECELQGVPFRIDSSILGSEVVVRHVDERPSRNRLILADHSQVWLS